MKRLIIVATLLVGCATVRPYHVRIVEFVKERACTAAKKTASVWNPLALDVPCDIIDVQFHDSTFVTCPLPGERDDTPTLGCCLIDYKGPLAAAYIKVALRQGAWQRTLEHEYCHAVLGLVQDPLWISLCHEVYGQ